MNPNKQVVVFDGMFLVYRTPPWLMQRTINIGFSNGKVCEYDLLSTRLLFHVFKLMNIRVLISTLEQNKNLHLRTPKTAFYYLKKDPTDISMEFRKW